jgi:hypothetical protein
MLASITPLGERGRQSTWAVTVTAFALGAAGTAMALGTALGALGGLVVWPDGLGWAALLAAVVAALIVDVTPARVPGPRRQVDPGWLDRYRGWVYGLGYGAQLGLAVTTVVTSAATYAALLAAFLTGSALGGAIVMGCYGVVRGLTPLAAAGVRSTQGLIAVHAALERWRGRVRALASCLLALSAGGALLGVLS